MLDLFRELQASLWATVETGCSNAVQSVAFAMRLLGTDRVREIWSEHQPDLYGSLAEAHYSGYPKIAELGYRLGSGQTFSSTDADSFLEGLRRLRLRSETGVFGLRGDDISLLGIAEGLERVDAGSDSSRTELQNWLISLIDNGPSAVHWTVRMRALAGDILDRRGRLKVLPQSGDVDTLALELVLRRTWPAAFVGIPIPSQFQPSELLKLLLYEPQPAQGDLERAVVRLQALEILIDDASVNLCPTISDTARVLANSQHSLKRWRWESKTGRTGARPSQWLIDNEYDVQSFLWALLYPICRSDLVDERYLPNWGHVQPRADLGITSLKLIIEVKIARNPSDFRSFEGQISADLGLYFKQTDEYDRMIVFIYDDCDDHQPERYDSLKNALKKRERIEDVIIVRRPSMIPNRGDRGL